MLQAVFFAEMASEEGKFRIDDSLDAISEKLIRRHPHIFADATAKTADDVKRRWDEIKAEEKKSKGEAPKGRLETVPRNLPALMEAQQITSKAAATGFDWENAEQVLDKLDEELHELAEARADWFAGRTRRRDRRPVVRAGKFSAFLKSRSRAGAAQNQRKIPHTVRLSGEPREASGRDDRGDGSALAGG